MMFLCATLETESADRVGVATLFGARRWIRCFSVSKSLVAGSVLMHPGGRQTWQPGFLETALTVERVSSLLEGVRSEREVYTDSSISLQESTKFFLLSTSNHSI